MRCRQVSVIDRRVKMLSADITCVHMTVLRGAQGREKPLEVHGQYNMYTTNHWMTMRVFLGPS